MKILKHNNTNLQNNILKLAYFYVLFPLILFFGGWLKWYYAFPCILLLLFCYYNLCKGDIVFWKPELNHCNIVKIVFIVGIIFVWVYFSGIGKLVYQNTDHECRNTIFEIMVGHPWPIKEIYIVNDIAVERGLIYYIAFWLPSAVVGKFWGLEAGYFFQIIWAVLGVFLFYYIICIIRKKLEIWPLLLFVFFSGLDIVGYFIISRGSLNFDPTRHLEWWCILQYSSFTTQLFWVFNQAVPAWLIFILIYMQKSNKNIVFLLSLSMLSSTLPFVGMIPFVLYFIFSRKYGTNNWKDWLQVFIKDTFTFSNIVGGGMLGLLLFTYLSGNEASQMINTVANPENASTSFWIYMVFILLDVGVYWIILFKYQRRCQLFYLTAFWLVICPLIKVGNSEDFCMRASIPALILLYLFVIDTLEIAKTRRDIPLLIALLIVLSVGSMTPIHEFTRAIVVTIREYRDEGKITFNTLSEEQLMTSINFSGNTAKSVFYKVFCK